MKRLLFIALALAVSLLHFMPARAEEQSDPAFDSRVAKPAFTTHHPMVRIDQAHFNAETIDGRYRPLADLLANDGCRVEPGTRRFSTASLDSCDVLVIANALGASDYRASEAGFSAFTDPELAVVRDWVRNGGSLLLIADQSPYAAAADKMAKALGVDMARGLTVDTRHQDPSLGDPGCILYTREDRTLMDHPITRGRSKEEKLSRVVTFTGQSLLGPKGSASFLVLQKPALDLPLSLGGKRMEVPDPLPDGRMLTRDRVPAEGRAQGVAFEYGKGRVVVLGESIMLSAQIVLDPKDPTRQATTQAGMNRPDLDNRQLALNIVHWLTRTLK